MTSIPQRPLGKTGARVSALALGGHHLGDAPTYRDAEQLVAEAVDAGITFFDNCWEYHNGRSEDWLGRALSAGGRRDKVLVMTKVCTHGRDATLAMQMLDESLRRRSAGFVNSCLNHLEEEIGELDPNLPIDPRFIDTLLIRRSS